MIRLRLLGLAFIAVLAMSAIVASVATAEPEFTTKGSGTVTGITIKGTAGTGKLEATNGSVITCSKNTSTAEITGPLTIGKVVVKYTGCKGKEGTGEECSVNSKKPAGGAGEIIVDTTKGQLGLVAAAEATSKVGVLFEPESGTEFVNVEGTCLTTAPVEGKLAGEATPVLGGTSKTGKLVFVGSGGSQHITKITVKGKSESPKLTAFFGIISSSLNSTETLEFSKAVEVT
jgi:hypothetical protein